jgi:hypothetical protein
MLVCNVSLRPRRTAIAAELAEAVAAADALGTGNVVFATQVDDPANVADIIDAYLGEIMVEAASASDTIVLAGATYGVAIDEAVTAGSVEDATVTSAIVGRCAMLAGRVFVNPSMSREANAIGTMVNL